MITRSELETRYKALKAKVEAQKAEKDKLRNALSQIKQLPSQKHQVWNMINLMTSLEKMDSFQ